MDWLWNLHEDHHRKRSGSLKKSDMVFIIFTLCLVFLQFISVQSNLNIGYRPLDLEDGLRCCVLPLFTMWSFTNDSSGFQKRIAYIYKQSGGLIKCIINISTKGKVNLSECYMFTKNIGNRFEKTRCTGCYKNNNWLTPEFRNVYVCRTRFYIIRCATLIS